MINRVGDDIWVNLPPAAPPKKSVFSHPLDFFPLFWSTLCIYYRQWREDRKWGRERCIKGPQPDLNCTGIFQFLVSVLTPNTFLHFLFAHVLRCISYFLNICLYHNLHHQVFLFFSYSYFCVVSMKLLTRRIVDSERHLKPKLPSWRAVCLWPWK